MEVALDAEVKALAISAAMAENRRRTNACARHWFDTPIFDQPEPPVLLHCIECNGWLPLEHAAQYARGVAAQGGDPTCVIPEFTR